MINWLAILRETAMITGFVILIMLLIEFVNVLTKGGFVRVLAGHRSLQIFIGTLLGLMPGCMGVFTAVSLYTHRLMSFGALVAAMIATVGDEAFFMFAYMPDITLLIMLILGVLAVGSGFVVDKIPRCRNFAQHTNFSFEIHPHDTDDDNKVFSFKKITFTAPKIYLLLILLFTIVLAATGFMAHNHQHRLLFELPQSVDIQANSPDVAPAFADLHAAPTQQHQHHHHVDQVAITIIIAALISMIIVLFGSRHFVEVHLWDHLIKKHLPRILFWTFLTLMAMAFLLHYADFGAWIYDNPVYMLLIALLVGLIPQSGPHLIFTVLFIGDVIPFSVLLANSIVQNGHGPLPLFAESKRSFFIMKAICLALGAIVGVTGMLFRF